MIPITHISDSSVKDGYKLTSHRDSFVHLHCHADGSMLDGLALVENLIPEVERLGMPAIALTDHGSMSATYDLYKVTKNSPVKAIYGSEMYLAPDVPRSHKAPVRWSEGGEDDVSGAGAYTHMTLLAETNEGLTNLFTISSESYLTGMYRKPRADTELLAQYSKGIIATTGCPSGEVQTWLRIGNYEKAKESAAKFAEIFGKDNFFVELMYHGLDIEKRVISDLLRLAKDLKLPTVATNDLHYVHKEDAKVHEALLCIQSGSKLSDPNRFKFDAEDFYLKTAQEMRAIWDEEAPDACDNTLWIAERCDAHFEEGNSYMPKFPIPEGHTEETWFAYEVQEGLKRRYPNGIPEDRQKQAAYETEVITQMGFPGYFLIVSDFINWAKNNGIGVGPGRGCLSGESNILTPTGFKKIKDIHVGDIIFDGEGNQVVVPQVFTYECNEPLIEVKAHYGGEGIKMTADHKVLVSKTKKAANKPETVQGIQQERNITPPVWMRADEIEKGDLVVMPKISFPLITTGFTIEQDTETSTDLGYRLSVKNREVSLPRTLKTQEHLYGNLLTLEKEQERRTTTSVLEADWIPADYDTGFLFGIFISSGHTHKNEHATAYFTQQKNEDKGIISQVDRVFGTTAKANGSKDTGVQQYSINNESMYKLFQQFFPDNSSSSRMKHIPDELFTTSEEFRRGLLEGLWYGGGNHSYGESKYETESPRLAENIFTLLSSLGLPAGIASTQHAESHPENAKTGQEFWTEYTVTTAHNFDTNTPIMGFRYDGDYTYYRVKEINKVPAEEFVYDFTVPTTNSYVTDSYVVHNSAAGSLVAYALNITDLDPIENGLIFERFLNPERVSPPDIDIDFDDRRRGEVIEYVRKKYGDDKVAHIGTFMKVKAKAAVKDAARVLDFPYILGDKLTKAYPPPIVGRDLSLKDAYDPDNERYKEAEEFRNLVESDPDARKAVELAKGLEGVKRGHGMHAAGVIMSSEPLMKHVPLMKRDAEAPVMTQFEYPTCEKLGLIKMDFLGLSNLSTINETLRLIKKNQGKELTMTDLWANMNDPATYKLLARGDTLGVFQLDSVPIRSLLRLMSPTEFNDISAVLALYRPGPMAAGAHTDYADRKNNRKPIVPIHPDLEEPLSEILGDTYGLCVTGDTLLWDATTFTLVPIDSIAQQVTDGSFYTFGVDEEGKVGRYQVTHWANHGRQRTLKIRTHDGTVIHVTPEHRMLTQTGWKQAQHVVPTLDSFAIPSSPFPMPTGGEDMQELIGALQDAKYQRGTEGLQQILQGGTLTNTVNVLQHLLVHTAFNSKEPSVKSKYATTDLDLAKALKTGLARFGILADISQEPGVYRTADIWTVQVSDPMLTELLLGSARSFQHTDISQIHIPSDIHWVRVESVTEHGVADTYDITVEGVHNFLANGLVSSNCIYQEQVMSIAQKVAGYTLGQADMLRRAMGKKSKEILDKEFTPFKEAANEHGYSDEAVQALWDVLVPFSDYAFNRAHSAAYGYISYATAYLKANYPVEYMAGLLTTNASDKDKTALYLNECRQMGTPVLPPDASTSEENYSAVGDSIRVGLVAVKNVGHNVVQGILQARETNGGSFASFGDFLNSCPNEVLKKRVIESLAKAGAFDSFGHTRAGIVLVHAEAVDAALSVRKSRKKGQDSLFAASDMEDPGVEVNIPNVSEWDKKTLLAFERELLGLYVSDHPLNGLSDVLKKVANTTLGDLKDTSMPSGSTVRIAGLVTGVARKKTKNGDSWALVTVEDLSGDMNVYCFPRTYQKFGQFIELDTVVQIDGRLEHRDDGSVSLMASEVKALNVAALLDPDSVPITVKVAEEMLTAEKILEFRSVLQEFPGQAPVLLHVIKPDQSITVFSLGVDFSVTKSNRLVSEIKAVFGFDAIDSTVSY